MWILESSGDFLNGKRLWLKPGKKYLFGRVKKDGVRFAIDHKTVSRRHFIIEVSDVQDGEVAQIHTRTKIKIIDQNSKSGTTVNGHILKGTDLPSRELDKANNSVRPGTTQELLIKWQPCVVTFNLQKKELKSGVLKQKQDRVRPFGIKAIAEFAPDLTTHLVVIKRNTPKGLQALITGKFLVSESFIDAIEYAATPTNLDGDEDASPLELDFDTAWPSPKDHLPAPGREPTARPVEAYQPGPDRSNIFEKYVFVFGDQAQHETLLSVITTGHGKALHLKVVEGETTLDEVYDYMLKAGGKKSADGSTSRSERGGAVLVRWDSKSGNKEWTTDLINHVALKMDQRAIDQSEFLDAILANDATLLKQAIPFESMTEGRIAPPPSMVAPSFNSIRQSVPAATQANRATNGERVPGTQALASSTSPSQAQQPSQTQKMSSQMNRSQPQDSVEPEEATPQSRKDRFRMPPPPRKDFDDGFDSDDIVPYEESEEEVDVKSDEDIIKAEPQSTRKRRRSPTPEQNGDSFDEEMDDLLPAATAMKRRKLELDAEAKRKGLPPPTTFVTEVPAPKPKKKKKEIEIDVREVARAQREKEAEEAEKRRERWENMPPIDETDKAPANLVVVETLNIPVRKLKITDRTHPEDDPRWDPKWNGRKNFKKFRPQTSAPAKRAGHASKVIVPLVEVKRKGDGIGEQYWGKTDEEKERQRKKKEKERQRSQRTQAARETQTQTQTQTQTARGTGPDTERLDEFDFNNSEDDDARQTSPAATRLQEEAAAIVDHDIDMNSPRRTRGDDARARTQTQTQTQTTTQGKKRPPPKGTAASQAKKRQKTLPVTVVHGSESEEDSDEMRFEFASRKGKGKDRA